MTISAKDSSQSEIIKSLKKLERQHYFRMVFDFGMAPVLFWVALLASLVGSIISYGGAARIAPWMLALLAGVPGFVFAVDRTFGFEARYCWLRHLST
jgi:hypothetical protein